MTSTITITAFIDWFSDTLKAERDVTNTMFKDTKRHGQEVAIMQVTFKNCNPHTNTVAQ